jgi:hypothetical protein
MHEVSDRTRNEVREVSGSLLREAAFFTLNCFPYETFKTAAAPQCGINKVAEKTVHAPLPQTTTPAGFCSRERASWLSRQPGLLRLDSIHSRENALSWAL